MLSHIHFFKNTNLSQRQAVLGVLFLYSLAAVLVMLLQLLKPTPNGGAYLLGGLSGTIIFGSAWILYLKRSWEPARYFAAIASTLLVALFLPEPFVSQYAPMAVVIPTVLALILTEPLYVLVNALLTIGILIVRAHGDGVYTEPTTLITYSMIVGGLLARQLIGENTLRQVKEAKNEIKQSETRFRSLIENSSDEISILDASGNLLYESPSSNPMLGYRSLEFIGKNLLQLVHPTDQERVQQILDNLIHDPNLHPRDQFRLLHSNGTWRWIEAVGTNLLDEPSVRGLVINYHDVTQRVQAEEKIQKQLTRLNGLRVIDIAIASSLDLNVTLDIVLQQAISLLAVDACAVLLVNPELQTLDYTACRGFHSQVPYHTRLSLGKGYPAQAVLERKTIHISNVMEEGNDLAETRHLANEAFVDYYGAPLIVKGEVKGVMEIYHRSSLNIDPEWLGLLETLAGQAAIAIDNAQLFSSLQHVNAQLECRVIERTAELNKTNAELERANRTKDEFLATMSHELRTPLNSILGLSESLLEQRRGLLNNNQQKSLELIESSGRHLLELINDILDLSKIEAGMFDFYPQLISLDEFCRSCLAFVKAQALKKSITITYIPELFVFQILADPRRLKQILINLLINAVKFTPESGSVILRVNAYPEHDLIQFSVIDNGIGIAPEDLQRLFQPFVQVDSSLSRQYEGTGLGLALVQKLTDLHGGSVKVESEVGKGSRFTINLPYKQNEIAMLQSVHSGPALPVSEQAKKIEVSLKVAEPHGTILLAEDNLSSILTVSEYLESHEYRVVVAHDGLEAIEKAEEINPDIILMDVQMPAVNGLEAIARLRENPRFASTLIIALTALAMPGDKERCLLAGANQYMSKPVSLKSLKGIIESFLQVHSAS
jgi:PAS domain S-box-containing protein